MDMRDLLDAYVVTAVPGRRRAPALELVWSEAEDLEPPAADGVLEILDDYRITRVPKAS